MGRLELKAPFDFARAPLSGWTRRHWEEAFFILMKAIADNASPGGARQVIPGPRSHHGLAADELEGFTRSFIMAGPWLAGSPSGSYEWDGKRVDVAGFYRRGILAGTDPRHPEYWGDPYDYAQHLVECASLAWALWLSRRQVWDTFSPGEQEQVARYLLQCTRVKYHPNNWLLFNVVTNAALKRLGRPYSPQQLEENLAACEPMYLGEGWYRDGGVDRIDYYNAWAFHYYYLIWVILDGDSHPALAEVHRERARQFARTFRYFFAADGSTPCFGRSMIYRFGYLAPIALARYLDCLDIPDGEVQSMMNLGAKYFLTREVLTGRGHLALGYIGPCEAMLEHYSCGGSPYWAGKAFHILLLPEQAPFWKAKEEPLPIHRESYVFPIRKAGLLLAGHRPSGHVQLVNQRSRHDKAEYNARYTHFAYSSVFGYEARPVHGSFNCDNSLQFSADGVLWRERWTMEPLYCEKGFAASRYPLFEADGEGRASTWILVKDDFMINFHEVACTRPLGLREGGYPLGFDLGEPRLEHRPGAEAAFIDGKASFIRNLHGWDAQAPAAAFGGDVGGCNVRHLRSVVPRLEARLAGAGTRHLATLTAGRVGADSMDQLMGLVTDCRVEENTLEVGFYDGERTFLQIGDIRHREVRLNGRLLSGPIVAARVAADGRSSWLLLADGTVREEPSPP